MNTCAMIRWHLIHGTHPASPASCLVEMHLAGFSSVRLIPQLDWLPVRAAAGLVFHSHWVARG